MSGQADCGLRDQISSCTRSVCSALCMKLRLVASLIGTSQPCSRCLHLDMRWFLWHLTPAVASLKDNRKCCKRDIHRRHPNGHELKCRELRLSKTTRVVRWSACKPRLARYRENRCTSHGRWCGGCMRSACGRWPLSRIRPLNVHSG